MTNEEKKQLEFEIRHIFESGANEIRIYDMVVGLIERREQASKTLVQPDVIGSCRFYEQDNTTAMNCKHCGKSKWMHGSGNLL